MMKGCVKYGKQNITNDQMGDPHIGELEKDFLIKKYKRALR